MDPSAPWRVLESPAAETPARSGRDPGASVPWTAVAALGLALVLAVAAFLAASSGTSASLTIDGGVAPGDVLEPGASPLVSAVPVLVEVSGGVAAPGVYELPPGARIGDAISAAGGFGPRVDTGRAERELNLAAPLTDGVEVHVPTRDELLVAAPTAPGTEPAADAKSAGGKGLVDINSATVSELEALPGIGPATAAKLIAARDEQPFASVDELRTRKVLGAATFEKVRELVTALR